MKKIITIFLILTIVINISSCNFYNYDGWQTIEMKDCGTIKIPEGWSYHYDEDGLMNIMNGDKLALLQFKEILNEDGSISNDHYDKFYGEARYVEHLSYHYDFAYDATISKIKYDIGVIYVLGFGDIYYLDKIPYSFVVCDDTLSEDFILKLCSSYIMY
ncbi:MAG: hypothetical protein IJ408_04240 [Clostridia bacterium]|nr:hypothetical protein [Clostridia bacterium]